MSTTHSVTHEDLKKDREATAARLKAFLEAEDETDTVTSSQLFNTPSSVVKSVSSGLKLTTGTVVAASASSGLRLTSNTVSALAAESALGASKLASASVSVASSKLKPTPPGVGEDQRSEMSVLPISTSNSLPPLLPGSGAETTPTIATTTVSKSSTKTVSFAPLPKAMVLSNQVPSSIPSSVSSGVSGTLKLVVSSGAGFKFASVGSLSALPSSGVSDNLKLTSSNGAGLKLASGGSLLQGSSLPSYGQSQALSLPKPSLSSAPVDQSKSSTVTSGSSLLSGVFATPVTTLFPIQGQQNCATASANLSKSTAATGISSIAPTATTMASIGSQQQSLLKQMQANGGKLPSQSTGFQFQLNATSITSKAPVSGSLFNFAASGTGTPPTFTSRSQAASQLSTLPPVPTGQTVPLAKTGFSFKSNQVTTPGNFFSQSSQPSAQVSSLFNPPPQPPIFGKASVPNPQPIFNQTSQPGAGTTALFGANSQVPKPSPFNQTLQPGSQLSIFNSTPKPSSTQPPSQQTTATQLPLLNQQSLQSPQLAGGSSLNNSVFNKNVPSSQPLSFNFSATGNQKSAGNGLGMQAPGLSLFAAQTSNLNQQSAASGQAPLFKFGAVAGAGGSQQIPSGNSLFNNTSTNTVSVASSTQPNLFNTGQSLFGGKALNFGGGQPNPNPSGMAAAAAAAGLGAQQQNVQTPAPFPFGQPPQTFPFGQTASPAGIVFGAGLNQQQTASNMFGGGNTQSSLFQGSAMFPTSPSVGFSAGAGTPPNRKIARPRRKPKK